MVDGDAADCIACARFTPRVGVEWFGTETAAKMCGRMHSPPRKTKLAIIIQQPPDFKPAPLLLHNFRTETP